MENSSNEISEKKINKFKKNTSSIYNPIHTFVN